MDIVRAKEIISALADGIHPLTGEVLPNDHVCNQAEVVRAFYVLLNRERNIKNRVQPENAGKPWTAEADDKLKMMYENGKRITEISECFGRTKGAIESRLEKLGVKEKH